MSNNPQWKSFQPPLIMNSDSLLEYKSMASPLSINDRNSGPMMNGPSYNSNSVNHFQQQPYHSFILDKNGSNNDFSSSTSNFSASNYNSSFNQSSNLMARKKRPPMSMDIFNGDSVSLSSNTSNSGYNNVNQVTRETGIIEKLLHSYGFIQCCERQARLFFHFSQFTGNTDHLKIGDPVEFEMTYDRRTGKPIASSVTKIAPEVVLSEERVTGCVTTELRTEGSGGDTQGRISYENRGECFFLPYNKDDVEGNVTLRCGDKVSFQIATNARGNLGASHVRLENPAQPVNYKGVICSIKETYGYIERADVVKEIFFHVPEEESSTKFQLGDDVEFNIQTRQGKEVAVNMRILPPGSVVFEDVCDDIMKGQVLKTLEDSAKSQPQASDPLPGRIRYRAADHSEEEIPFGDKDQIRNYTLKHGDWVQFRIATDRRDQLKRATQISLMSDSFEVSGEKREQGVIAVLNDKTSTGFIDCVEREAVKFQYSEVIDTDRDISVGDEVEFTVKQESFMSNEKQAIRVKHMERGSVQFEVILESNVTGTVVQPCDSVRSSPSKSKSSNGLESDSNESFGWICYQSNGVKKPLIKYYAKNCDSYKLPHANDQVTFNVSQVKRTKDLLATNVSLVNKNINPTTNSNHNHTNNTKNSNSNIHQGYIAAIKESFGFIETITHDREVFFHYSNLHGDPSQLELGLEVEYTVAYKNSANGTCKSAENVRILPKGTIKPDATVEDETVYDGVVVRSMRSVNPDQPEYSGLIRSNSADDAEAKEYEFNITSLVNKRELLQANDPVQFQVDSKGRAANLVAVRIKRRTTVDSVKGTIGFLSYEVEEGKKLFFRTTEVNDGVPLQPGDQVEFFLVTNQRSGRSSACNITKVKDGPVEARPERLISRLRTVSIDDGGPKLTVIRQPRGADNNAKGFSADARRPRAPGVILE
ncbi:RNA-binding protein Unr isoform X2 [Bemisia tabaci]|uniref:RNA-binding protein Unr isoform X2 n=1 Tax=Bemisia tabaci TaxID=7038 RepID=UPI0008F9C5E6|nr:PREDICTED: cold shock domain-containing protein E1 isoform X2 [Bemisia tabaci]